MLKNQALQLAKWMMTGLAGWLLIGPSASSAASSVKILTPTPSRTPAGPTLTPTAILPTLTASPVRTSETPTLTPIVTDNWPTPEPTETVPPWGTITPTPIWPYPTPTPPSGPAPDLSPVTLESSPTLNGQYVGVAGGGIQIHIQVKNQGAGAIEADAPWWTDELYLSTSNVIQPGDIILNSFVGTPALLSGESYDQWQTIQLQLHQVSPGNYFLILKCNAWNNIPEENYENNLLAIPFQVLAPPPADLAPVALGTPIYDPEWGLSTVSYSAQNLGTGIALGNWEDALYFSLDDQLSENDKKLNYAGTIRVAEAQAIYSDTFFCEIPTAPEGDYYLILSLDNSNFSFMNWLQETDETNNILAVQFHIGPPPPGPDLKVIEIQAPASAQPDHDIPISWTVQNLGEAAASGDWNDLVFLSKNPYLAFGDLWGHIQSIPVSTILDVQSTYLAQASLPSDILRSYIPGQYYLIILTDGLESLDEMNEINNYTAVPFEILPPPLPDLVPIAFQAPSVLQQGLNDEPATFTIQNQGSALDYSNMPNSWTISIYASKDNQWSAEDIIVWSNLDRYDQPLAPGELFSDQGQSLHNP